MSTQSFGTAAGNTILQRVGTFRGNHDQLQFTARDSRFGLRLGAPDTKWVKASAVIEADFGKPLSELFATLIRQYKIGSKASLTIVRDGKQIDVPVTLDPSPRLPREMKKYEDPNFEFRVRDIAAATARPERDVLLQGSRNPRRTPVLAPLAGKVVTFDAQEQLLGKTVKPGDPLLRVARVQGRRVI